MGQDGAGGGSGSCGGSRLAGGGLSVLCLAPVREWLDHAPILVHDSAAVDHGPARCERPRASRECGDPLRRPGAAGCAERRRSTLSAERKRRIALHQGTAGASTAGASTAGPRVCFVIPTCNEADNITLLLRRLTELYRDPNIWWLRLTTHRTFIKFSLTGLSGVFVNLGSFHLLLELGLHR